MRNWIKIVISLGLFLVGSGCSTIPIASQIRLASMNPLTLDFSVLKVAVRINDDYRLSDGDVVLTAGLKDGRTGEELVEAFQMVVAPKPESRFLDDQLKRETIIYGMSFAEEDKARVLKFREKFSELKNRDKGDGKTEENSFFLNVNTKGCMARTGNPFAKMRVKVYLKPSLQAEYMTFVKEREIDLIDNVSGQIPFCIED